MDNVVDLSDHALFLGEQATGATSLIQCVWIYDRAVDLEGLRRFHGQLRRGRLSRRIERSPLPFGRLRWVAGHGGELELSPPRPAAELEAWLHEQANTALDCVSGPGWHLALLPFASGGAAVSLVISHTLTDGVGLSLALADAVVGRDHATAWPAAGSRGRWRAVRQDIRRAVRDLPTVGRALRAAATMFPDQRRSHVRLRQSVVAANAALSLAVGPVVAPLIIAVAAALIALIVYLVAAAQDAAAKRREEERRKAAETSALVSSAVIGALPLLLKSPLLRDIGVPAVAAIATALLLRKADRPEDSDKP